MNILEMRDVSKSYGKYKVLNSVDLCLQPGRIVGLLGPNGSGKTTIIKLINNLLKPNTGSILVGGKNPGIETNKIVSYLPERSYLDVNGRVKNVLKFFSDFYEDFDQKKALELLMNLEIDENAKIKTLSKGAREKLQLVLVMSRKAKLYVLDEPMSGVDPAARDRILDTILTGYDSDSTILISTHLISDIERVLDDVIMIHEGKIIYHEDADDLRNRKGKSIDQIFREEFR